MSEYLVVIEREGDSWGAHCPDLPGVGVVGESAEEVERLIREAVAFTSRGFARIAFWCRSPWLRRRASTSPEPTEAQTSSPRPRLRSSSMTR